MSSTERAVELHGDVRPLTFLTGKPCFLLQLQVVQVEGVTVVSKRHPGPVSQGVRALAGVGPLVHQRIILKEETVSWHIYLGVNQSMSLLLVHTRTANFTDSSI